MGEQVRAILAWAKERGGTFKVEPASTWWKATAELPDAAGRMATNRVALAPSPEEAIGKLAVALGAA